MMKKVVKNALQQEWLELTPGGISVSRMLHAFARLEHSYGDPQRRFHSLSTHIRILLQLQKQYFPDASLEVILALWFHDIFYLPGYKHSEAVSTDMMRLILHGIFPEQTIEAVAILIMATIEHGQSDDRDTQIVCDLDLFGLASDAEDYNAGVRHIRAEYNQFSDAEWSAGRRDFLTGLLSRTTIFQTEELTTWLETAARTNLQRDLDSLPID